MPRQEACKHPNIISTAYLALLKCTSCDTTWTKTKDGHYKTIWILNKKGGDKTNDVHVSQESPKSRRVG